MSTSIEYKKRIHLIDTIRGVIIIGVVGYHLLFDLVFIFGLNIPFLFYPFVNFVRDFGAGMLIFISGIACNLSHSNLKRGIQCLIVALLFSLVTRFVIPDEFIFFGVLHLLAICMIGYHLLRKFIDKIPVYAAPVLFVIFLFLFCVPEGNFGFFGKAYFSLPEDFKGNVILYCLGFPWRNGIYSADYFPLIPWALLFLTGNIIGRYFKNGKGPAFLYMDVCPPVTFIGTKTLIIYVLHQPVVYGILNLIFYLKNKA